MLSSIDCLQLDVARGQKSRYFGLYFHEALFCSGIFFFFKHPYISRRWFAFLRRHSNDKIHLNHEINQGYFAWGELLERDDCCFTLCVIVPIGYCMVFDDFVHAWRRPFFPASICKSGPVTRGMNSRNTKVSGLLFIPYLFLASIWTAIPKGVDFNVVKSTFLSVDGIRAIHNLRIWGLTTEKFALSAHLAIGMGHTISLKIYLLS